jgi:hypothetical protein
MYLYLFTKNNKLKVIFMKVAVNKASLETMKVQTLLRCEV